MFHEVFSHDSQNANSEGDKTKIEVEGGDENRFETDRGSLPLTNSLILMSIIIIAFMHYYDNPGGSIPTWLINWAAKVCYLFSLKKIELENIYDSANTVVIFLVR